MAILAIRPKVELKVLDLHVEKLEELNLEGKALAEKVARTTERLVARANGGMPRK